MERAVDNLEKQMQKVDEKLDKLAAQTINVEKEVLTEKDGAKVEVNNLLNSLTDLTNDYQNLQKELLKEQENRKQLNRTVKASAFAAENQITAGEDVGECA